MADKINRRDFLKTAARAALGTTVLGAAGACSRDRGLGLFEPVPQDENPYGRIDNELVSYANKYVGLVQDLANAQLDACLTHSELESTIDEMYHGAMQIAERTPAPAYGKKKAYSGTSLAADSSSVDSTVYRIQPGDSDANGVDNIFDLLHILRVLSGKASPTEGTDANQDGKYNIFDVLELLKILRDPNNDRLGPTIDLLLENEPLEDAVTLRREADGYFNLKIYVDDERSGVHSYKVTVTPEGEESWEYVNSPEIELPALDGAYDIKVEAKDMVGNTSILERTFTSVPLNAFYGSVTETLSRRGLGGLEVELTLPGGEKHTANTNHQGVYSFNVPTPAGYSTIKIAGHQSGHEPMYNYENNWVELNKASKEDVQMIYEAEDPDNPGYDLLEHLKWVNGNGTTPGERNIRWRDDLYPLKVFWDRENAPSNELVDMLKGGWDLWEEVMNEQLPDMDFQELFEEVMEMPEMGIHCTWDYDRYAQFVFEEGEPYQYSTKGRVDWNGDAVSRNINLPGVEPGYAALAAHEFGHALGVSHSPKDNHIMGYNYTTEGIMRPAPFEALTAAVVYRLKTGTILLNYKKEG